MSEHLPESFDRSDPLPAVLDRLKALHALSANEKTDTQRINEGKSNLIIGKTTQEAFQALVAKRTFELQERAVQEGWDAATLAAAVGRMEYEVTEEIFKEHWYESTLSTPDYPIHAATYGTFKFRYGLRMLMNDNPSPDRLREFAWIMLDADGLRSFKDCTSHENTTCYLQGAARILVGAQSPTRQRLEGRGIRIIPMATGGDEFVLYLRAPFAMTQEIIDDVIASFQREISTSEELGKCLNFDDESVLIQFGLPSSRQRKEFMRLSDEGRRRKLAEIRATMPARFVPSFSGGGALLTDGIALAVERDERDLQGDDEDFASLREKIIQATIQLAEDRQKENKDRRKAWTEKNDPKQFDYERRYKEQREMAARNRELEADNQSLKLDKKELTERNAVLQSDLDETRRQLAELLAKQV